MLLSIIICLLAISIVNTTNKMIFSLIAYLSVKNGGDSCGEKIFDGIDFVD